MALRWKDVDLGEGLIRDERAWDPKAGVIEPKSAVGRRKVPITPVLRRYLVEHRIRAADVEGLVFGRVAALRAHSPPKARRSGVEEGGARADHPPRGAPYLRVADDRRGGQREVTVDVHGTPNISITLERYGHLMPGNEAEAASLLDAYLEHATPRR
jgi:integrase